MLILTPCLHVHVCSCVCACVRACACVNVLQFLEVVTVPALGHHSLVARAVHVRGCMCLCMCMCGGGGGGGGGG